MRKFQDVIILLVVLFVSCISNDIPYPYIEGVIQEIEVEAQVGEAEIDRSKRTIHIIVDEYVEIEAIKILKLVTNKEAILVPDEEGALRPKAFPESGFTSIDDLPANANTTVNFTKDFKLLLKTYQDYEWTISVTQVIERVVTVEGQTGEAVFDEENKKVLIYVPEEHDLTQIKFLEFNLEGKNSRSNPDPFKEPYDFTRSKNFSIYRGNPEKHIGLWTVQVIHSQIVATVGEVDTWARRVTLNGGVMSGATPVVEYKKASDVDWTKLEQSAVTMLSNTTFKAKINGLRDGTSYEWRVNVGGKFSDVGNFNTEKIEVVPNMNFDVWTSKDRSWYPNVDVGNTYWATGNDGVTTLGSKPSITEPVEGKEALKGKAAKMTTITGVVLVGAAAGNLFIGDFKTQAGNPSKSPKFGRDFTGARPDRLEGYFRYYPKPISRGTYPDRRMDMDEGHIYIKIWDNDNADEDLRGEPFAYAEIVITETVTNYKKFSIPITYKNLKTRPKMMTIVATSSRYGGEFDGKSVKGKVGEGSTLYVDEFELIYE